MTSLLRLVEITGSRHFTLLYRHIKKIYYKCLNFLGFIHRILREVWLVAPLKELYYTLVHSGIEHEKVHWDLYCSRYRGNSFNRLPLYYPDVTILRSNCQLIPPYFSIQEANINFFSKVLFSSINSFIILISLY